MKNMKHFYPFQIAAILLIMTMIMGGCSSGGGYTEEGLDTVIKSYRETPDLTILLYDQNYEGNQYQHQYQVLIPLPDSSIDAKITPFYPVSDRFFNEHIDDLGMELATKTDGVVKKTVAPAGYSQYVGNPKYGHWTERNGTSFWEFYGKFAFMNSMFHMFTSPARYSYWNDYNTNYAPGGRTYRGPGNYYGTDSYMKSNAGKSTSWSKKPSSFRNDVRSRVQRSSTASKAKVSRTSSRYSSSSSSRSRSGGFGK